MEIFLEMRNGVGPRREKNARDKGGGKIPGILEQLTGEQPC